MVFSCKLPDKLFCKDLILTKEWDMYNFFVVDPICLLSLDLDNKLVFFFTNSKYLEKYSYNLLCSLHLFVSPSANSYKLFVLQTVVADTLQISFLNTFYRLYFLSIILSSFFHHLLQITFSHLYRLICLPVYPCIWHSCLLLFSKKEGMSV